MDIRGTFDTRQTLGGIGSVKSKHILNILFTVNQLISMAEGLTIEDGDFELIEMTEPSNSHFTELFMEQEKMKVS